MKNEIHHPHDSLFKKALQHKEVAIDFLKNRLPSKALKEIDLATVTAENTTFIESDLKASYSDLVLSANIKGEKGYIYTLVELQTQNDDTMPLRLLEYNVRLMRKHVAAKKGKKLPTIINIVLYAGAKPYKGAKCIMDAFEHPNLFMESLRQTFLINLTQESETQIMQDGRAALVELVIRQGVRRDCESLTKEASVVALINASMYGKEVVYYILDRTKHDPMETLKKIANLGTQLKHTVMGGLQRALKEKEQLGRQEGIRLGEQRGIQLGEQRGIQLGISTILELARKGHIDQAVADRILKEKFGIDK